MKSKWRVNIFHDIEGPDYEISVIRKGNKHGHRSWGWNDENKIILPATAYNNDLSQSEINEWVTRAVIFANALNEYEQRRKERNG